MPAQRFPLVGNPLTRKADTDVDAFFKNCYPAAVDQQNMFVIKRPGLKASLSHTAAAGRGLWNWRGNLFSVTGNTVRKGSSSVGTINTTTGPVYFTETGGTAPKLVFHDLTDGWIINTSDTLSEITDADFPTDLVHGIAFLDQYVFVMDEDGQIWNSDVNDPTSWGASNYITAESLPDQGVCITNHLNYIIALNEYSIDFFYDAAAGSAPLEKVKEAVSYIGCAAGASVVNIENSVIFVGQDRTGGKRVYAFEGLSPSPISTKPINRLLDAEGSTIADATAWVCKIEGHAFYVLTLPTTGKTIVYDFMDKGWHEWSSYNGSTESYFTGVSFAEVGEVYYVQDEDNGKIYELDSLTYQDDSNAIKVQGVTDLYDADVSMNKFMHRLKVIGDINTTSGDLSVSYTDDNYKTYSTTRTIDLSSPTSLTRLGKFERRAFKYTFEANAPMRLEAFEFDLALGDYGE